MACASIKERQIVETIITVIPRKTDLPLEVLSNEDKISLCTPEVSFSGLPTQVFQEAAKYSFLKKGLSLEVRGKLSFKKIYTPSK